VNTVFVCFEIHCEKYLFALRYRYIHFICIYVCVCHLFTYSLSQLRTGGLIIIIIQIMLVVRERRKTETWLHVTHVL